MTVIADYIIDVVMLGNYFITVMIGSMFFHIISCLVILSLYKGYSINSFDSFIHSFNIRYYIAGNFSTFHFKNSSISKNVF